MTDQSRFEEIERVFSEAVQRSGAARAAYLDQACADDPPLRQSVEELLGADASGTGSRIDRGVGEHATRLLAGAMWRDPVAIAGFRVVRRIGAGGMGVVYEAEQERPARRVAIKLLRAERLTETGVRRMEFEGEVLGRLAHPGIATVYEAGVWDQDGVARPYVAMELIEGVPLTEYAQEHGLDLRERLELFVRICDAAHHAHQRGVIHRDLKPANILVDQGGNSKIVDFGIARGLDMPTPDTVVTQTGQLLGTLGYMAPERLSGGTGVDARGDIYSLGVVLYELLGGCLPHEFTGQGPVSLTEAIHRVTQTDARPLGSIDPGLRGDLEVIVATAIARDPDRRYPSASAFAEDIRRYLGDMPILARRPSSVYQLRKFARRNRGLVVAACVVALGVVVGVGGITIGLREAVEQRELALEKERDAIAAAQEAQTERARAERQAAIAVAITSFLNIDLLGQASPELMGRDVTVREAVDAAAGSLNDRFETEPEVRAAIRNTIAGIYDALSEYDRAVPEFERAIAEFAAALGEHHELTERARQDLGRMYRRMSEHDAAAAILVPLHERFRDEYGASDERTLRALIDVAEIEGLDTGNYGRARELFDQFERDRAGVFADDSSVVIRAVEAVAMMDFDLRRFERAAEGFERVVAAREASGRPLGEHMTPLNNLAASYEGLGRYDEAEPIYERVLEICRRTAGPDNLDTLAVAHNLAFLLASMGRNDEAEPLFRDTLERCGRVLGEAHEGTLTCMTGLAALLRDTDRPEDAIELLESAWERAVSAYGTDSPMTAYIGSNLGILCSEIGPYERAIEVIGLVLPSVREDLGDDHPQVGTLTLGVGRSLLRLGRAARAKEQLIAGRAIIAGSLGPDDPQAAVADRLIAEADASISDATIQE